MNYRNGRGVYHARASVLFWDCQPQDTQPAVIAAQLSEQVDVERLRAIVIGRLLFHLALREGPNHLAQRSMVVGGIEEFAKR